MVATGVTCRRRTYDPRYPGSAPGSTDPPDDSTVDLAARRIDLRLKLYEWVKCWVVNERDTGTLEVRKALSPASDPGRFDLLVDGKARAQAVGDGGTTGAVTVAAGTHAVGEEAVAPANARPVRALDGVHRLRRGRGRTRRPGRGPHGPRRSSARSPTAACSRGSR